MRQKIVFTVFLVVVLVGASLATSKATTSAPSGTGVLSVLAKGQPVNLKEAAGRYSIIILPKGPETLPYKVAEVGPDYVVVQDSVGVTELRIPIWSVKEVQVLKVGGR